MKNMNLILSVLGVLTFGTTAFAGNGVEKVLPADASSVQIAKVTPGFILSSQTLLSDGIDGPNYQNNYSPAIDIKVTYQSKDNSDDETALSESGEGEEVVGGPTLSFSFEISPEQAAAIKAKTLDPSTLVALSVTQQTVTFDEESFGPNCRFNNESGAPEDASCIIHTPKSEVRPVLSIDRK